MSIIFVTGSDAAFFNSMLVGLQSFAERMPGQRLLVCDFGFSGAQAGFLRGLGVLLERPPVLASAGAFHCKAALLAYLRHNAQDLGGDEIVVWLDADLTFMDLGIGDFVAVFAAMTSAGADIAVCPEPLGRSFGQMLSGPNASTMAPSARIAKQTGMDFALPYLSSGLFFCRSAGLWPCTKNVAPLSPWTARSGKRKDHRSIRLRSFRPQETAGLRRISARRTSRPCTPPLASPAIC